MVASTTATTSEIESNNSNNNKKIQDKLLKETWDESKFSKMDYAEGQKYANKLEDLNLAYRTVTKAKIILGLAEKLKNQDYPILEIKEKITEGYEGRIDSRYISQVLPEEYKRAKKIAAGKKTRAKANKLKNKQTTTGEVISAGNGMVEPELQFDDSDDDNEDQQRPNNINNNIREPLPDIQPDIKYSEEYVTSLIDQVKALKGELKYSDILATEEIMCFDKQTTMKLMEANSKSKSKIYVSVDSRTREIKKIFSDKDWNKQQQQKK